MIAFKCKQKLFPKLEIVKYIIVNPYWRSIVQVIIAFSLAGVSNISTNTTISNTNTINNNSDCD